MSRQLHAAARAYLSASVAALAAEGGTSKKKRRGAPTLQMPKIVDLYLGDFDGNSLEGKLRALAARFAAGTPAADAVHSALDDAASDAAANATRMGGAAVAADAAVRAAVHFRPFRWLPLSAPEALPEGE